MKINYYREAITSARFTLIIAKIEFKLTCTVWGKVQDSHLTEEYRDDEDFRLHVRMLLALSFVRSTDVTDAF